MWAEESILKGCKKKKRRKEKPISGRRNWLQRKLGLLVFYKILETTENHHVATEILLSPWNLYGIEVSIWWQPGSYGWSSSHSHNFHKGIKMRAPGRVWNKHATTVAFAFLGKSLLTSDQSFLLKKKVSWLCRLIYRILSLFQIGGCWKWQMAGIISL